MDATLATVAVVSLLLAWAMAIVSWQRVRAERRRSDTRVANLMAELAELPVLHGGPTEPGHAGSMKTRPATAGGPPAGRRAHLEPRLPLAATDWGRPDPDRGASAAGSRAEPAPDDAGGGDASRGAPPGTSRPWGARCSRRCRRRGRAGATARAPSPSPPSSSPSCPSPSARRCPATARRRRSSCSRSTTAGRDGAGRLDHRRRGDYLAVTGSLRNPPHGRERARLSITATAFDRTGAIVGRGQTPLPVEALPAGDETAFTISLPDADRISRYRVSFMEDQSGLPHVDRRGSNAATAAAGRRP